MRKKIFKDYDELANYMYEKATDNIDTVAVLFFDDSASLLKKLLVKDGVTIDAIDIAPEDFDGYSKEYYISLGSDLILDVEPAHNGKKYLNTDTDLMLIHGDASSAIIRDVDEKICREIYIGTDTDDDTDDDIDDDIDDKAVEEILGDIIDFIFDNAKIVKKDGKPIGIKIDVGSISKHGRG